MKHLRENNYSYLQHLRIATKLGIRCFIVGFKLIVHGLFPNVWQDTGWRQLGKGS